MSDGTDNQKTDFRRFLEVEQLLDVNGDPMDQAGQVHYRRRVRYLTALAETCGRSQFIPDAVSEEFLSLTAEDTLHDAAAVVDFVAGAIEHPPEDGWTDVQAFGCAAILRLAADQVGRVIAYQGAAESHWKGTGDGS